MPLNIRDTADFRTAGTGATRCSAYWGINQLWSSPEFVVETKSGKWRMVTDLRTVNKAIQPMGPVLLGIPLPSQLPKAWPLIVTDLKYFL